jgi:hypothetical protein
MGAQVTVDQVEKARIRRQLRPWYRRDYIDVDLNAKWTYVLGILAGMAVLTALSIFLPVGAWLTRLYLGA